MNVHELYSPVLKREEMRRLKELLALSCRTYGPDWEDTPLAKVYLGRIRVLERSLAPEVVEGCNMRCAKC